MALNSVSSEAFPAPAVVSARPGGDTVGLGMTLGLSGLADVHRGAGGVGGVQPVAWLTGAGVAPLQVDTEAVLQRTVVTLRTSHLCTLVNVDTVTPVTLNTTSPSSLLGRTPLP